MRRVSAIAIGLTLLLMVLSGCFLVNFPNMVGTWKTSVTKIEGGSVTPIDLVVTVQEGADFNGTALVPFSTYTGTVEGEITRFGKIVMKVVLSSIKEGIEFTLNMSGTVSGENMSGAASALMNGYPVDSDYTWLSVRE